MVRWFQIALYINQLEPLYRAVNKTKMVVLDVKTEILYGFILIFGIVGVSWTIAQCYHFCQSKKARRYDPHVNDGAISLVTARTQETIIYAP